jgi:hypothetical protein
LIRPSRKQRGEVAAAPDIAPISKPLTAASEPFGAVKLDEPLDGKVVSGTPDCAGLNDITTMMRIRTNIARRRSRSG